MSFWQRLFGGSSTQNSVPATKADELAPGIPRPTLLLKDLLLARFITSNKDTTFGPRPDRPNTSASLGYYEHWQWQSENVLLAGFTSKHTYSYNGPDLSTSLYVVQVDQVEIELDFTRKMI